MSAIAKLRAERERLGMTQADVAVKMGVSQPVVSEIESEKADPLLSTLQRYHRAVTGRSLRVSLSYRVDYPTPRTDRAIAS